MGKLATGMLSSGMLVFNETHVGIVADSRLNTPQAQGDLLLISELAAMEGCGIKDRCWPVLFYGGPDWNKAHTLLGFEINFFPIRYNLICTAYGLLHGTQ